MTRHYRLVDYATQAYVVLVGLLILTRHGDRLPHWPWLFAGHLAALAGIHLLVTAEGAGRGGLVIGWVRQFYPILMFTAFYREAAELNRLISPEYLDPVLIRAEERLFGMQPSLVLMERWPQRWVAEILYGAYFSYYLMIGGLGVTFLIRDRRQFAHYVTVISLVFYVCYLVFIACPIIGPPLFHLDWKALGIPSEVIPAVIPPPPESVRSAWFFVLMRWIYDLFEAPGAAFPSSHVAVAVVTLYFSRTYLPRFAGFHAVAVGLLCVATVYGRYHYVLDVVAGLATAAVLLPIANSVHRRFEPPGGSDGAASVDRAQAGSQAAAVSAS